MVKQDQLYLYRMWTLSQNGREKCNKCILNSFGRYQATQSRPGTKSLSNVRKLSPIKLQEVDLSEDGIRLRTGIGELDRVLGGGLVGGSLSLIGGDPGVGKSTLLLMALSEFAKRNLPTLYVSGEESARQIRLRADRLQIHTDNLHLLAETDLDACLSAAEILKPKLLVLDSVQHCIPIR